MAGNDKTFEIPAERESYLAGRFTALQKRAAKLALGVGLGFEVIRRFDRVVGNVGGTPITAPFIAVRVWGDSPCLEGWSLRGRFDFKAIPGETMRAMVPGFECPAQFHAVSSSRCDACGEHRKRSDSFLLQHEAGRFVVVGRSCLRDYLGHVSPESIAACAAILAEVSTCSDEDGDFWGARVPDAWALQEILAVACYSVRTLGWAPSKADQPTREDVVTLITPVTHPQHEAERQARIAEVSDADRLKAAHTIAWLKDCEIKNDYLDNLKAIARAGVVTGRALGLAVSAPAAYDRAMEREVKRQNVAATSNHVGTIKKREVFTLRCAMIRGWDTAYGYTTLYKFADEHGNVLTWKASRSADIEVGDLIELKATVKAHDVYKDVKQTLLTRGTVVRRLEDAECRKSA